MKVKILRNELKDFLAPIVRVSEGGNSACALYIEKDLLYTITYTPDLVCIYYGKLKPVSVEEFKAPLTVYIADIRRILTALSAIDDEEIVLDIDDKCISYKSPTIKFKCFLLDEAVAPKQRLNADRINEMTYDTEFIINETAFSRINKGCVFTENNGKIYFYTENDKVFIDIDDKAAQHNVNNITFIASDGYEGSKIEPISPLTIESFKIIGAAKNSVLTKVNISKGIYMFYYKDNNVESRYLIRALKS